MIILGINTTHADAAACLVINGSLHGAVAEERLGKRIKHDPSFPSEAVRWLLADAGIRLRDVTHVALARDSKASLASKLAYVASRPLRSAGAVAEHFRRRTRTSSLKATLAEVCDEDPSRASFQLVKVEHHLAHIASAYYLSPFESLTAGFSYDASGDFASAMAAKCEGTSIDILDRVNLPHSLGFFYTAMCQFIGFDDFGEEYKVMGLAPYGEDRYSDLMKRVVVEDERHWFRLSNRYFGMHDGGESGALDERNRIIMGLLYTDALVRELGQPRPRNVPISQREMDIARSTQIRFEEVALHCLQKLHRLVPSERLVMAGGCALNGVANTKILRKTEFRDQYLQAASSDDGTCLGAAYHCWHQVLGRRERFHMAHAFWGPHYSEDRLRRAARESGYIVKTCEGRGDLIETAAAMIADGRVIGWYQGRSEWGPRALGHRSILANASIPTMKDTINEKIKRRESFRPIAPTVLNEYVCKYF